MLIDTGICNKDKVPHVKCTSPSWRYVFKLSFKEDSGVVPDHGGEDAPFSFEAWFHSWDQTGDPDVFRLCQISWNASRGILNHPNNPDRKEMLERLSK